MPTFIQEPTSIRDLRVKIKYKREELGDVYVSNLATSALRAMGLYLVSNDIIQPWQKRYIRL